MDFIIAAVAFLVGFGLGCVFYRAQLKRNPERLANLAAAIKRTGEATGKRFE